MSYTGQVNNQIVVAQDDPKISAGGMAQKSQSGVENFLESFWSLTHNGSIEYIGSGVTEGICNSGHRVNQLTREKQSKQ